MNCRACPRGFTLIELIAVISIVAILSGFAAATTLSTLASVRARGAAARITSDLRYAQRHAMSTRLNTWLVFQSGANRYALFAEDPANPGRANRLALANPLDNSSGWVVLSEPPFNGVALSTVNIGGTSEVAFDYIGRPADANGNALSASGLIQLDTGVVISITPVTGLVEVAG